MMTTATPVLLGKGKLPVDQISIRRYIPYMVTLLYSNRQWIAKSVRLCSTL
ncbi:hypothetical protein PITCH_A920015 [uncultured Desulfobacterium sp.]|uniref:Uncharacterized protein n=1 Tax=uncultured Desulfobacterium sp. TaxID=201089 RepID=A0A445N3U3_9BACT|nr:hypothetical protein PITCH_A920015 [uncultured Desulfobacterium sp.]